MKTAKMIAFVVFGLFFEISVVFGRIFVDHATKTGLPLSTSWPTILILFIISIVSVVGMTMIIQKWLIKTINEMFD